MIGFIGVFTGGAIGVTVIALLIGGSEKHNK